MKRWLSLAGLTLLGVSSIVWSSAAQQSSTPAAPDPANFTGKVTASSTSDIRVRYTFDPAARTNWHSHGGGQTIIIEQGKLRARERGGARREFGPRETYTTPPGVAH
jgi:quercetin dioxygenase-like cupin family protein